MLEPFECEELLVKARERYEFDHRLMYTAITNALGGAFNKHYRYNDVFEKKEVEKEVTKEEKERLKKYFENW